MKDIILNLQLLFFKNLNFIKHWYTRIYKFAVTQIFCCFGLFFGVKTAGWVKTVPIFIHHFSFS